LCRIRKSLHFGGCAEYGSPYILVVVPNTEVPTFWWLCRIRKSLHFGGCAEYAYILVMLPTCVRVCACVRVCVCACVRVCVCVCVCVQGVAILYQKIFFHSLFFRFFFFYFVPTFNQNTNF
jgi:hypothetical protein